MPIYNLRLKSIETNSEILRYVTDNMDGSQKQTAGGRCGCHQSIRAHKEVIQQLWLIP